MCATILKIRRAQSSAFNADLKRTVAVAPLPPPGPKSPTAKLAGDTLRSDWVRGVFPLRISPEQQRAFELAARKTFEDEMVGHSRDFTPRLCEVLGEKQLRVALRQAMDRANTYGFTFRGPLRLYVEMMFLFGSSFDTDPQYPWAATILKSADDQMQRAEQLFYKIIDFQEKVSGHEGLNTHKALVDLLALARNPVSISANNFVAGMSQEMRRVFPQKAAYMGEASVTALIRDGSAEARKNRFQTQRGEVLMVVLMYAFGHGCAADPLYPWIGRTLRDDNIIEPAARADRLEKRSVTWLEYVLAQFRKGTKP